MKEEIILQEKIKLLEKEIATLADTVSCCRDAGKAIDDLKMELRGLKLFLSRHFAGFKEEFLDIVEKLESTQTE